ncbi:MAG: flagellin lysine-N-methylase [Veillonellaceae bacterium]|nr:flagellin lysine-N-methylase [Veillonellaceae bacterium]
MSNNDIIILQPKYVADFQCDGSKCNAKCCGKWRIDIDMETYKKYQRIKNPAMRKKILSSIQPSTIQTGFQIKLNNKGVCPLLCEDNLCYIQRNMGEDALSQTCKVYPRMVQQIGNYQFRMLAMTCPVAAEYALLSPNAMELQQISCEEDTSAWKLIAKNCNMKNVPNDLSAVHIMMGGLAILQNTSYTFEQRLVILGLFLDKVEDCQQDVKAVAGLIDYYNSDTFQQEISNLWENWQYYPVAHHQFMNGIITVLKQEKELLISSEHWQVMNDYYNNVYEERHHLVQERLGSVLERYWQHEWLFHAYPYSFSGGFWHNYFSYLIAYELCQLVIHSTYALDNAWAERNILDVLGEFSKSFDHKRDFSKALVKETEIFEKEPLKLMQVLLRLK